MTALTDWLRSVRMAVTRPTLAPLVVRLGIAASMLAAFLLAYPVQVLAGRPLGLLVIAAILPAAFPRRVWPTVAILVAVLGWLASTMVLGEPVTLPRLLGLAASLYLSHSLCALAAVLPHDAVVAPEVPAWWVLRALGVLLAAGVLSIGLLKLVGQPADRSVLAALGGLAAAVALAALLAWPLRRR